MEEARPILRDLREIGSEMMTYLARYAAVDYKFFRKRTMIAMDGFDTTFDKLSGLFPREVPALTEAQERQVSENIKRLEERREKVQNRYSKEIEQDERRFQRIYNEVGDKVAKFTDQIQSLTDQFDEAAGSLRHLFEEQKSEKESAFQARMKTITQKVNDVQEAQNAVIAAEEEKITAKFLEQVEQKSANAFELQESIAEIERERLSKLEEFDKRQQQLFTAKERDIAEVNEAHDKQMELIDQRQAALQQAIYSVEERISTMQHRAMLVNSNHEGRRSFMHNSLQSQHTLNLKKARTQAEDMSAKIAQTERMIDSVQNMSLDSYQDQFDMMEKSIQYEIDQRDTAIADATDDLRKNYENKIAEQKEKLRELDAEISDNQLKAIRLAAMNQEKLNEKISALQSTNQREIDNINGEISRITGYLSKVHGEWSSLKSATRKIYEHRMIELRHRIEKRKEEQEQELLRVAEENQAVEDSTDYDKLLKDELDDVEGRYRDEEKLIEDEKVRLLNITVDEDRMRGALSTRKQFAEELNILKESENDLKAKLLALSQELLKIETMLNDETAVFAGEQQAKLQSAVRRYEEELEQEKKRLEEELARIREEIQSMKKICLEREKELQLLQKKLEPPKEEDRIKREQQLREEFEQRTAALKESIAILREDIAKLTEQLQQLTEEMNEQKNRGDFAKQKLNDLQDTFQKSVDRVNSETRTKYERMLEAVRNALRKLEDSWRKEEDNLKEIIRQRMEELNLVQKMFEMHVCDVNNDTQKKMANIRDNKAAEWQDCQKSLASELAAEEEKFRAEVETEVTEFGKQERWRAQDNKILLKKEQEEYEHQLCLLRKENSQIKSEVADLQHALLNRLKWTCPECETREREIKEIKSQILSFVQKMHETEKEDSNRIYAASHFGQSPRALPRLRAATETADVY